MNLTERIYDGFLSGCQAEIRDGSCTKEEFVRSCDVALGALKLSSWSDVDPAIAFRLVIRYWDYTESNPTAGTPLMMDDIINAMTLTLLDEGPERLLGMPEKEFCDRLVENAAKRSPLERMIPIMRNVLFLTFGFYTLEWLMEGIPADFGITNRVLLIAGVLAAVDLFDIRARGRIVYLGKWKRGLFKGIIMLAWVVMLNTCIMSGPTSLFPGIIPENFLIMGKGIAVFAVLLILALALFFWNNYFWDRCSRRYQWE